MKQYGDFMLKYFLCVFLLFGQDVDKSTWKEVDWSKHLAAEMNGVAEYRLPDDSRVDVLTDKVAWEVEWVDKWPESIGQALFYSASTDREPGVILLMRGAKAEENYLECLTVVNVLRQHFPFRLKVVNINL